ncbi:phenylalanine--tRNA ligase subunit beta [Buchnera aphidicola]|uniref:phenylalanine--tRNA ligase subunit beta n=1 Tax=Buchnera aphidicola TaxID=9 RepID=UPI0031B8A8B7
MKLSLSWLKLFLNKKIKNNVICNQLTKIGLEVENLVENKLNFKRSIVGKILSIKKKNNVYLCKIYINKTIYIKLKSKNKFLYIGMKLAIGLKKYKDFNINKILLYSQSNINKLNWKIYTYSDFKLFGNKNSIVEFPKNIKIGTLVKNYFDKISNDTILINVTPNRNDCLGLLGLSRDLSVINNFKLKMLYKIKKNIVLKKNTDKLNFLIKKNNFCFSYFFKILENINISIQTPFFIRECLRKSHIKSINIVSDVINYVSLELGQSIHVFDYDKIKNNSIEIRLSKKNDKFYLKKNLSFNLFKNTLVILNNKEIISLGGFIQSKKFSITKKTKNIYLGSGVFNNFLIDRIKNKYKNYYLSYDNHFRKCDTNLCLTALNRISKILIKYCSGNITSMNYLNKKYSRDNKKIIISYKNINKILGFKISKFIILNILKKLKYIIYEKLNKLEVIPPSFRIDILCMEDVISDILRFYGYNKVPSIPLKFNKIIPEKNFILKKINKIKNFLLYKGYFEVINYSFTDLLSQKFFIKKKKLLKIINPISKDYSYMRASLIPGLIKNVLYNKNRQKNSFSIFESGLCFKKKNDSEFNIVQNLFLSGIKSGFKNKKNWFYKDTKFNYYDLKSDIENILSFFFEFHKILFKKKFILGLDRNFSAKIYYKNDVIGYLGMLNNIIKNFYNLKDNVFIFEIFIDKLFFDKNKKINEFLSYPYSSRDISIIVSNDIPAIEIISLCYKISLKKIFKVYVFDVYTGTNIPINKKSLSIRIFFKNNKKNITNNEIESLLKKCLKKLKNKFNAKLRDK